MTIQSLRAEEDNYDILKNELKCFITRPIWLKLVRLHAHLVRLHAHGIPIPVYKLRTPHEVDSVKADTSEKDTTVSHGFRTAHLSGIRTHALGCSGREGRSSSARDGIKV